MTPTSGTSGPGTPAAGAAGGTANPAPGPGRAAVVTGVPVTTHALMKTYRAGDKTLAALDGIDLDIPAGSLTALMGASGSGKSTLLHILGGMDTPTGGTLQVGDQRLDQLKPAALVRYRRRVGFVFQRFHLLAALTALDNVIAPVLPYENRRQAALRARGLLEEVGLADRGDALPSQLSGGQQQRVAIARALIADPPLILADEPTGALDTTTGADILDLLEHIHQATGPTILIATHDPTIAARCQTTLTLRDGHMTGT